MTKPLWSLLWLTAALLAGCMVPNTYYDPVDPYAYGLRWYDRGRYDLAVQYWDPLAEKGDCDAEYWVGMLYFLGRGKPQDNDKALQFWRKAASASHPKAQGAMADLYYQNDSVIYHRCKSCDLPRDLVEAYIWYKLMAKSARYDGEKKYAATALWPISAEMSAEQIAHGEARLSQWRPTPKDCKPRNWW